MTAPEKSTDPKPGGIVVRHCHGLEEFNACYILQQRVWGKTELDVPLPLFIVAEETGGQVLGAFDGDVMVGFTYAIVGYNNGNPYLHSHMTAVLEGDRDRGIGRRLKILQLKDAVDRGIDLIEWTFDPLEIKNAYFNFMRLGAIARRYLPNFYGVTTSPLHGGMPTDRLVAEWWLGPKVVLTHLEGLPFQHPAPSPESATIFVPAEIARLRHDAPVEALRIQTEVRDQFQNWFAKGFAARYVEISPEGGKYILEPWKGY